MNQDFEKIIFHYLHANRLLQNQHKYQIEECLYSTFHYLRCKLFRDQHLSPVSSNASCHSCCANNFPALVVCKTPLQKLRCISAPLRYTPCTLSTICRVLLPFFIGALGQQQPAAIHQV